MASDNSIIFEWSPQFERAFKKLLREIKFLFGDKIVQFENDWLHPSFRAKRILLLLWATSVFAAASSAGINIWPAMTTSEVNKVWTIVFNNRLLSASVNDNTIFVTDSKQQKISTRKNLATDGLTVTVTPTKAYAAGDYNLYISNEVTSLENV